MGREEKAYVLEILVEFVKVNLDAVVVHGSLHHFVLVRLTIDVHGILVLAEQHIFVGDGVEGALAHRQLDLFQLAPPEEGKLLSAVLLHRPLQVADLL